MTTSPTSISPSDSKALAKALLVLEAKGDRHKFSDHVRGFQKAFSAGAKPLTRWLHEHRGSFSLFPDPDAFANWVRKEGLEGIHQHLVWRCQELRDVFVLGMQPDARDKYKRSDFPSAAAEFVSATILVPIEGENLFAKGEKSVLEIPLNGLDYLCKLSLLPTSALEEIARDAPVQRPSRNSFSDTIMAEILSTILDQQGSGPFFELRFPQLEQDEVTRYLSRLGHLRYVDLYDLSTKDGERYAPIRVTLEGERWLRMQSGEEPKQLPHTGTPQTTIGVMNFFNTAPVGVNIGSPGSPMHVSLTTGGLEAQLAALRELISNSTLGPEDKAEAVAEVEAVHKLGPKARAEGTIEKVAIRLKLLGQIVGGCSVIAAKGGALLTTIHGWFAHSGTPPHP